MHTITVATATSQDDDDDGQVAHIYKLTNTGLMTTSPAYILALTDELLQDYQVLLLSQ